MKNSKKITAINNRNKVVIGLTSFALIVLIISILFHLTPLKMITIAADFASHHYFLVGFFALLSFFIGMKSYFLNTEEINELRNEKNKFFLLKLKQRRIRIQNFKNGIALKMQAIKNRINGNEPVLISKYSSSDVLVSKEESKIRQQDLKHAMRLGNSFRQNVKLYYKESNLHKCIETVILFVSNDHVTVRGGDVLPVKSIYKVEI